MRHPTKKPPGSLVADPIATEVVGNRLVAIADEMAVTLIRGAYSTLVKESADASSAIFDRQGQLLAQSTSTLILHVAALREALRAVLSEFPVDDMRRGDAFVMSDPYRGGIHANDLCVYAPVVDDHQRVRYIVGSVVHVADVGGVSAGGLPSEAKDIYQEGVLLPPMRLCTDGQISTEILNLLALNSRAPVKVRGDVGALVAAVQSGTRGLRNVIEKYDHRLEGIQADILRYTEARMRSGIAEMPISSWDAEFHIDDGMESDAVLGVKVRLEHSDDHTLEVDLSGSSAQVVGPINSAYSQTLSAVLIGVRCFLDQQIPMNEGVFRAIRLVAPPGSIVNPRKPAAVNARNVIVTAVVEALLDIMSRVWPERAIAGSSMVHAYTMNGTRGSGDEWLFMDVDFGGVGGRHGNDGVHASGPYFFAGRGLTVQLEALEAEYPIRFRRLELIADSGGAGKWPGGAGLCRELETLEEVNATVRADRIQRPPRGRNGGQDGRPGGWMVSNEDDVTMLQSKQMNVRISAGSVFTMLTSGGGGLGNPLEREPDAVLHDVRTGVRTVASARDDFGVVVVEPGEQVPEGLLELDLEATIHERRLRMADS